MAFTHSSDGACGDGSWARVAMFLLAICAAVIMIGSCASHRVKMNAYPRYPSHLEQTETLDIQVFRNVRKITLTNTTARSFGPSRLWMNQWFGRDIDGLAIGQTITLDLGEFRDTNGERFRAGGFFAAERPDTLVLAQMETDGRLYGLIAVGERTE